MLVSRSLQPKTIKKINTPKSLMINEKLIKKENKQLTFAVGAGGVPPNGNDNIPSNYKKPLSVETLKKIKEFTKNMNKMTRKVFDIINKYSKNIK